MNHDMTLYSVCFSNVSVDCLFLLFHLQRTQLLPRLFSFSSSNYLISSIMGQKLSCKARSKTSTSRQHQEQPLSDFYIACRTADINTVNNLLPSMSVEQISRLEPNGSTALHAASYYGHADIVRILLANGACRSSRNLHYNLTPFEEAHDDNIRRLFARVNPPSQSRFIGPSSKMEWSLDTSYAAEWKSHLSSLIESDLSFQEMIFFLQENYLKDHINLVSRDLEKILWFFRLAYEQNDATFIVKAYTSTTQFCAIVNKDLAQYLLKYFRFDNERGVIEQSAAHLASIFIHRSELRSMTFIGTVYRGLLLLQSDLDIYTEKKCLLNKSFLSTSKERRIALVFGGAENSKNMRTTMEKTPLQYTALCIYKIKNANTAIDIADISENPDESEVLIMPLCAFQVQSVRRDEDNNDIQIEIVLEELSDESLKLNRKYFQEERPRVT